MQKVNAKVISELMVICALVWLLTAFIFPHSGSSSSMVACVDGNVEPSFLL